MVYHPQPIPPPSRQTVPAPANDVNDGHFQRRMPLKRGAERRPVNGHPAPLCSVDICPSAGNMNALEIATNAQLDRGSIRTLHAAVTPLGSHALYTLEYRSPASSSILGGAQPTVLMASSPLLPWHTTIGEPIRSPNESHSPAIQQCLL